jgi:hypothetical protein
MGAAVDKALKQLVAAITAEVKAAKPVKLVPAVAAKPAKPIVAKSTSKTAPAPGYKNLSAKDKIKKGDEWKLKDDFHHLGGKHNAWRKCKDSIGRKVGDFSKSVFRRKV